MKPTTLKFTSALLLLMAMAPIHTKARANPHNLDVEMELTAQFATMPGTPSFSAGAAAELEYSLGEDSAKINGETIPEISLELDDPPAGLTALTVIVQGAEGSTPTVDWSNYPDIALKGLGLHVTAYEAAESEITPSMRPLVDIAIGNMNLSTAPITLEGCEAGGYVDLKNMEVQLAGKVTLPTADFPPYSEHLAGEPVLLELFMKAKNPFGRKYR